VVVDIGDEPASSLDARTVAVFSGIAADALVRVDAGVAASLGRPHRHPRFLSANGGANEDRTPDGTDLSTAEEEG
jgi:hypothetical protein